MARHGQEPPSRGKTPTADQSNTNPHEGLPTCRLEYAPCKVVIHGRAVRRTATVQLPQLLHETQISQIRTNASPFRRPAQNRHQHLSRTRGISRFKCYVRTAGMHQSKSETLCTYFVSPSFSCSSMRFRSSLMTRLVTTSVSA